MQRYLARFEKELHNAPISLHSFISTSISGLEKTIVQYREHLSKYKMEIGNDADENDKYETRISKIQVELDGFKQWYKDLKNQCSGDNAKEQLLNVGTGSAYAGDRFRIEQRVQVRPSIVQNAERITYTSQGGLPLYEGLKREQSMFERSNAKLDSILQMGQESLEEIVEQNDILKRGQQKLMKSLQTLGVSIETIESINRRVLKDKFIFWVTLGIMFFGFYTLLKWFR